MIRLKRGDTFSLTATILGDGAPIVGGIASWGIKSQVRTSGGALIDELITTITSPTACTYTLKESAAGVTATWPVGLLEMDIQYTVNGEVISTETIQIKLKKDVTR
jgi:hypothetical protein